MCGHGWLGLRESSELALDLYMHATRPPGSQRLFQSPRFEKIAQAGCGASHAQHEHHTQRGSDMVDALMATSLGAFPC